MGIVPVYIPLNEMDKYFYNRQKDIKRIEYYLNSLELGISQSLLIRGVKGVGKTFLLQKIKNDLKNNFLVTYMDIERFYQNNTSRLSAQTVLLTLLEEMNNTVCDALGDEKKTAFLLKKLAVKLNLDEVTCLDARQISKLQISQTKDNYSIISKFVMEYPQNIVDNSEGIDGFIIMLDDFQYLCNLKDFESFFEMFGSYNHFQSNVSYMLSGSLSETSKTIEMLKERFKGLIQINIEPFSEKETKIYFKDVFSEITFTDDGFKQFYKYTRGIPMYINCFYNSLSEDEVYDEKFIDFIFFNNMGQILIMLIKIWGTLERFEKDIIKCLINHNGLKWGQLSANVNMSDATLSKYIKILQEKAIVKYHDKKYMLEDLMLETWLKYEKEITGVYPS